MAVAARIQHVGHQHRVVDVDDVDARLAQHFEVVFHVLRDLQDAAILQQRLQPRQHDFASQLALREPALAEQIARGAFLQMADGNVAGAARRNRQRHAHKVSLERIKRGSFRVDANDAEIVGGGDPAIQRLNARDGLIGRAVDLLAQRMRGAMLGQRLRRAFPLCARDRGARRASYAHLCFRHLALLRPCLHIAVARAPAAGAGERGVCLDLVGVDAEDLPGAPRDRGELQRLHESDKRLAVGRSKAQIVERAFKLDVAHQLNKLLRHPHLLNDVGIGQSLAPLGLFDLACARQQAVEIAVFVDELGGGLDANAGRAGHVVGGIARQSLHVHHFAWRHAEIVHHLRLADAPLLARARRSGDARRGIEHRDAGLDQLHQILVGGNDEHVGAPVAGLARIGGDEIVSLKPVLLQRDEAECARSLPHQRKLRDQILGRFAAIGLVGRVQLLAERIFRFVENDGQMGRAHARRAFLDELKQLGAEQPKRAGGQLVRAVIIFRVLSYRLEIGAENEIRRVDEEDMVALLYGAMNGGHGRSGPDGLSDPRSFRRDFG